MKCLMRRILINYPQHTTNVTFEMSFLILVEKLHLHISNSCNMKKMGFFFMLVFLLNSSCVKFWEKKYTVMLENKSTTRLYVAIGRPYENSAGVYPDTSLPANKPLFSIIAPNGDGYILY